MVFFRQPVHGPHGRVIGHSHQCGGNIFFSLCIDGISSVGHHPDHGTDCIFQYHLIDRIHPGKVHDGWDDRNVLVPHHRVKIPVTAGDRGTDNFRETDGKQPHGGGANHRILQAAHAEHSLDPFLRPELSDHI